MDNNTIVPHAIMPQTTPDIPQFQQLQQPQVGTTPQAGRVNLLSMLTGNTPSALLSKQTEAQKELMDISAKHQADYAKVQADLAKSLSDSAAVREMAKAAGVTPEAYTQQIMPSIIINSQKAMNLKGGALSDPRMQESVTKNALDANAQPGVANAVSQRIEAAPGGAVSIPNPNGGPDRTATGSLSSQNVAFTPYGMPVVTSQATQPKFTGGPIMPVPLGLQNKLQTTPESNSFNYTPQEQQYNNTITAPSVNSGQQSADDSYNNPSQIQTTPPSSSMSNQGLITGGLQSTGQMLGGAYNSYRNYISDPIARLLFGYQ